MIINTKRKKKEKQKLMAYFHSDHSRHKSHTLTQNSGEPH
ncbi:MAG: hypothetical protein FD143_3488, partial [Ignavibacteria bacterium]